MSAKLIGGLGLCLSAAVLAAVLVTGCNSMGPPYKVHVKDRDVFLCCPGCEEALRKDPDTYLAKIKP